MCLGFCDFLGLICFLPCFICFFVFLFFFSLCVFCFVLLWFGFLSFCLFFGVFFATRTEKVQALVCIRGSNKPKGNSDFLPLRYPNNKPEDISPGNGLWIC